MYFDGVHGSVIQSPDQRHAIAGATAQPELSIDFLSDGKPVAHGEPKLPAADESGRIAYIAETPIGTLKPGQYEVTVTVKQAGKAAQERLLVNIE